MGFKNPHWTFSLNRDEPQKTIKFIYKYIFIFHMKRLFTLNQKRKLEKSLDEMSRRNRKLKKHIKSLMEETFFLKKKLEEHNISWREPLKLTITPFKKNKKQEVEDDNNMEKE